MHNSAQKLKQTATWQFVEEQMQNGVPVIEVSFPEEGTETHPPDDPQHELTYHLDYAGCQKGYTINVAQWGGPSTSWSNFTPCWRHFVRDVRVCLKPRPYQITAVSDNKLTLSLV